MAMSLLVAKGFCKFILETNGGMHAKIGMTFPVVTLQKSLVDILATQGVLLRRRSWMQIIYLWIALNVAAGNLIFENAITKQNMFTVSQTMQSRLDAIIVG